MFRLSSVQYFTVQRTFEYTEVKIIMVLVLLSVHIRRYVGFFFKRRKEFYISEIIYWNELDIHITKFRLDM